MIIHEIHDWREQILRGMPTIELTCPKCGARIDHDLIPKRCLSCGLSLCTLGTNKRLRAYFVVCLLVILLSSVAVALVNFLTNKGGISAGLSSLAYFVSGLAIAFGVYYGLRWGENKLLFAHPSRSEHIGTLGRIIAEFSGPAVQSAYCYIMCLHHAEDYCKSSLVREAAFTLWSRDSALPNEVMTRLRPLLFCDYVLFWMHETSSNVGHEMRRQLKALAEDSPDMISFAAILAEFDSHILRDPLGWDGMSPIHSLMDELRPAAPRVVSALNMYAKNGNKKQ